MSELARREIQDAEAQLRDAGCPGAKLVARGGVVTSAVPFVPSRFMLEALSASFRFEGEGLAGAAPATSGSAL